MKHRQTTRQRRARILAEAKRAGFITDATARIVTGLEQAWYHLNALRKQGALRYDRVNHRWVPPATEDWEARFKREGANHADTMNLLLAARERRDRAERDLLDLVNELKTFSNSMAAEAGRSDPPVYFTLVRLRQELDSLIYASDPCPAESQS